MTRALVPLHERDTRMPEAGRIRLGIRSGKAMKALHTFRFTASSRENIDELAHLYGGKVEPMADPKSQHKFQVTSTTDSIPIYLPRDSFSTWYELWEGSGRKRQCDGVTASIPRQTPDGWEPVDVDCICHAEGRTTCRPVSRLNVIIPTIAFAGVWRLETKGWNAMAELPGMIKIVEALNEQGQLVQATLSVQQRSKIGPNGKSNFVVPVISLPFTPADALTGAANVTAIASAPSFGALEAGPHQQGVEVPVSLRVVHDDDIIDAEIVEDDPLRDRFEDMCTERYLPYDRLWPALCRQVDYPAGAARVEACIAKIEAGSLSFMGFNPDGTIIWKS